MADETPGLIRQTDRERALARVREAEIQDRSIKAEQRASEERQRIADAAENFSKAFVSLCEDRLLLRSWDVSHMPPGEIAALGDILASRLRPHKWLLRLAGLAAFAPSAALYAGAFFFDFRDGFLNFLLGFFGTVGLAWPGIWSLVKIHDSNIATYFRERWVLRRAHGRKTYFPHAEVEKALKSSS